ncbi:MAG TPA: lytic transglycosylase domain-containing protein [Thermoanaerobaculia bacterium]|nr:lytic transglycosylase domain-containing protein [Thermoanaerobaculia bacterium]
MLRRRAIALVVGVPLAFCALGFPIDAMNVSVPLLANRGDAAQTPTFHIFTTSSVRKAFLSDEPAARPAFDLDIAKEQFFKTEVPYGPIILREALRNDLPPELVAAVVQAESDFRPRLVSNKNAKGLMQIVPETAELLGCANVFNPAENIAAGTKYLRYLVDRFGDQRVALAAYNAGEGNVEHYGGIPPFPETRNYLQRVAQETRVYRQRINNRYVASVRLRTMLLQ